MDHSMSAAESGILASAIQQRVLSLIPAPACTCGAAERKETSAILERLLSRTTPGWGGCLVWTASLHTAGYGQIQVNGKVRRAHRVAYELLVGPIPVGMHLDHTCHNRDETCPGGLCAHRRCINPLHLEPVTNHENQRRSPLTVVGVNIRKTHCPQGHPYNGENLAITRRGSRVCRQCAVDHWAQVVDGGYYERRRAREATRRTLLTPCGYVGVRGVACSRPEGHDGKHWYGGAR